MIIYTGFKAMLGHFKDVNMRFGFFTSKKEINYLYNCLLFTPHNFELLIYLRCCIQGVNGAGYFCYARGHIQNDSPSSKETHS